MDTTSAARERILLASAVVGAWLLLALAWTPPTVLVGRAGRPSAGLFDGHVLLFLLISFLPWMAATPLLLHLARLFPVGRGRPAALLVHAGAGLLVIPAAAVAGRLLALLLLGAGSSEPAILLSDAAITAFYSLPTYVAVAAIAQGLVNVARERKGVHAQPSEPPAHLRRLPVREKGRTELIDTQTIDYVDVAGHYLCIHVGDAVHVARGQLGALERQLDPKEFARIHRSTLVRLDRVRAMEERRNGDCDLILAGGNRLLLSRLYRDSLRDRLGLPDL
jgi:hypothetical protein